MASVDKRPDGQWRARWREYPGGPQKSKHFDRKIEATNYLIGLQHDQLTGRYVDPVLGRTSFKDVAQRYVERGAWRSRTRDLAEQKLRGAVEKFGTRSVASLKTGELQSFLNSLDLAPSTVGLVYQHLAAALEVAVNDRLIAVNPALKLKLPRSETGPMSPMSSAEVGALIKGASTEFRVAIVLGAGLGLRLGEAAGLTVDRIDFLRRTVRVDRQWNQKTGSVPGQFGPPKTEASARTIPASEDVLRAIAAHLEPNADKASTVVQFRGQPLAASKWEYEMRRARKRAGVADGVSFHDLRHYFASALIAGGCSVKAVQSALGHRSASMTLDVYGHLWPGDDDRIRGAISLDFKTAEDQLRTTGQRRA